jgi:hypothetical protein
MAFLWPKADEINRSKTVLRQRFRMAVQVMTPKFRAIFRNATVDFEVRELVSQDGRFRACWRDDGTTSGSVHVVERLHCDACQVLAINGHKCHEHGCPEAWKDETRECKNCDAKFKPETRDQRFCGGDCAQADGA